jgi:hypothetical protein
MRIRSRVAVLTLALIGATALTLQAQSLKTGTWTGKGIAPEGEEFAITLDVQMKGDTLVIAMHAPDGAILPLTNIRFEDSKLLFTFTPGVVVNCTLSPVEGGGYSGPCTDEEGGTGEITMMPPEN